MNGGERGQGVRAYCNQRGIPTEDAVNMFEPALSEAERVSGFCKETNSGPDHSRARLPGTQGRAGTGGAKTGTALWRANTSGRPPLSEATRFDARDQNATDLPLAL